MKKHEENAAKGDLFTSGGDEFEQVSEDEVNPGGKVNGLVLPGCGSNCFLRSEQ